MGKSYFEKCNGYVASVYEENGTWFVNPAVEPGGESKEVMAGDQLIHPTPLYTEKPYSSLEKAQTAAHEQLEKLVGDTLTPSWEAKTAT
jgi:hypothetical protein